MEACYKAIQDFIVMQCGIAMNDGTDDLADNIGLANFFLLLFIL